MNDGQLSDKARTFLATCEEDMGPDSLVLWRQVVPDLHPDDIEAMAWAREASRLLNQWDTLAERRGICLIVGGVLGFMALFWWPFLWPFWAAFGGAAIVFALLGWQAKRRAGDALDLAGYYADRPRETCCDRG